LEDIDPSVTGEGDRSLEDKGDTDLSPKDKGDADLSLTGGVGIDPDTDLSLSPIIYKLKLFITRVHNYITGGVQYNKKSLLAICSLIHLYNVDT